MPQLTDWYLVHRQQSREQKKTVPCGLRLTFTGLSRCKGICRFVVFGFCVGFVFCRFLVRFCFRLLVPFAFLHALALSLTGA